eukprot:480488_1
MEKKYDWIVVLNKRICSPNKQPHVPLPIKSPIKQYDLPLQTTKSIKDKVIQIKIDASDSFKKDSKWNERIDFNGISVIRFLCDNGQIIRGDILTQKQGEIFVHFDQASCHYGKKYDWVVVPNKQICYPPNKKPPHVPLPIKSAN